MQCDLVHLPSALREEHLRGRAVVVFDVLRATTTMTAALAAGAREIRVFANLDDARRAASGFASARLLCGEEKCTRPADFDLGNSPLEFVADRVDGRTLFMSTTNGTRAIVAAMAGRLADVYVGALVNASAVAGQLMHVGRDVTLLCAGTDGEPSREDEIGAGAVADALATIMPAVGLSSPTRMARRLYLDARSNLRAVLRSTPGGQNVITAGLERDIDFAADVDGIPVVGQVLTEPLRVVRVDGRKGQTTNPHE